MRKLFWLAGICALIVGINSLTYAGPFSSYPFTSTLANNDYFPTITSGTNQNLNWYTLKGLISSGGINWQVIPQGVQSYNINWSSIPGYVSGRVITATSAGGVNWQAAPGGGGGSGTVTSFSFTPQNALYGSVTSSTTTPNLTAGINWSSFNALGSVNTGGINWNNIPNYATGKILQATGSNAVNWQTITALSGSSSTLFQYQAEVDGKFELAGSANLIPNSAGGYRFITANNLFHSGATQTAFTTKWKKIAGVNTITIYAQIWIGSTNGDATTLEVDVGGQNNSVTGTINQETPEWNSFTIDVSSLTNGTTYDVTTTFINNSSSNSENEYLGSLVAFGS